MKKRMLSLVLTIALLLSMVVLPANATPVTQTGVTALTDTCPCGCGKSLQEVDWKAWKGTAASGHFYLSEDYVQAEQTDVISGEKMVLDLRGNTISTSARIRLFHVSGYLAVLDTVGGGRLTARTPSTTGANGGVVSVADNETAGSTFELYSGTIMPSANAGKSQSGGLIDLGDGATFRMYGGMLLNGLTASNKHGGGIQGIGSSTVEILGGSIVGCEAAEIGGSIYSTGTVILKNCSVIGGKAGSTGGNIYMNGGSLTIENAVIADGISFSDGTYGGGNIGNVGGCKINIKDSVIRGGYSYGYGGNFSLGYGTVNITNTEIYGGVANKGGTNLALTHTSANVTLDGCTVSGGVGRVLGKLTLKGATKIGMYNGGLDLSAQSSKTTTVSGLTSGAEVYIQGAKNITGSLTYLKPLYRTTLSASGTTITLAKAADGETAGYCPHCSSQVAWSPYGTENATHTYLTENLTSFAETTVSGSQAIDLAGFSLTAPGRAFTVTETGNLGVLDSVGTAKMVGSGVNGENGGIFHNAGTLLLDGVKYTYTAASGIAPTGGGVVYNSGTLDIHGSQLVALTFAIPEGVTARGGAIYGDAGSTVNIRGGRVNGGTASQGGSAYFNYNAKVTVDSATFTGGVAKTGGNLYCGSTASSATLAANNKGMLTLTGVSLRDGEATSEYAGNLYMARWNADITDCYLEGGKTVKYGANLAYGVTNTMHVTNTILEGGTSQGTGGNFYSANAKNATFTDCAIIGGSGTSGGNLYVNNGAVTISGGEISQGTASVAGGNIHANTASGVTLQKNTAGQAPKLLRGTATDNGGNLYAADTVTVTDAYFASGSATSGEDLYAASGVTLTLGAGVAGDVKLGAAAGLLTADVYGGAISGVTCQESAAKYYLGGAYGDCGIILKDKTMYVAVASVLDGEGNDIWYSSNADAVAACPTDGYVKLFTNNDLVLTKDLYADLNGNTVNVSGDYIFYGMDASGDDFSLPTGKAILSGATAAQTVTAPNGNTYIGAEEADGTTYHRLDMKITGVSIRPSADGMYYSAKWSCDDVLKGKIATFGVVASTENMPNAAFETDEENRWTAFAASAFENGKVQNGAVIAGILKNEDRTAEQNGEYAKKPVYAKAYIKFTDGTTIVSNDNIRYSLYDVMKNLDKLITEKPVKYRKHNLSARNFYEKWKDNGMGGWNLSKIPAPTEDDGVIDLLMVGHSFCYYYVEELYNLCKAAGIKVRVCNLYYSGRPLSTHYDRWINGVSDYQLFEISDDTGGVKVGQANMGLESALAKYEWDYISLQAGTSGLLDSGAQGLFDSNKLYWESLLDYFIEQFPNARIGWHQAWANQANEYGREDSNLTPENQTKWADLIDEYGILVTDYYNKPTGETVVQRINTGRAWQYCREAGYDYLCARLGKTNSGVAHAGDGYHDGDIGGAQYLNACVWFEILTGQSVVGNPYVPEYKTSSTIGDTLMGKLRVEKTDAGYKLTDDFAAQLQNYAHQAVLDLGLTVEAGNYQ
ncbi:MAG: DUF4886 domain-containing protein [Oscillospiraceae bacterium]|nr:DUF4886 domain-containing protein [Oscillospiraceae bacterium]